MPTFHNLISDESHQYAIQPHHRYKSIQFKGAIWDLSHLNPFAINFDPGIGFDLMVVILFSCHCFSRALSAQEARTGIVCKQSLYEDGREIRILDESRYQLSRVFLPGIFHQLLDRKIQVLPTGNFLTFETYSVMQAEEKYAVFFDVKKDPLKRQRPPNGGLCMRDSLLHFCKYPLQVEPKRRHCFFHSLRTDLSHYFKLDI